MNLADVDDDDEIIGGRFWSCTTFELTRRVE